MPANSSLYLEHGKCVYVCIFIIVNNAYIIPELYSLVIESSPIKFSLYRLFTSSLTHITTTNVGI